VKPAWFEYSRPASVEEALDLLAEHGDGATVLAGGQSLVPLLNMRFARPGLLVDVNRIPGLDALAEENGAVHLGALVRQNTLASSEIVATRLPLAGDAIPHVGHFVTRNRGTVGGSIAHADARAELPLALTVLGGSVVVASRRGRRAIPAGEFFVTHFTSTIEPDELLVETVWPAAAPLQGSAFEEFAQRAGDYALAMAACTLRVHAGRVADARIGIGATVARPTLLDGASRLLAGSAVDEALAREVGAVAAALVDPVDSLHASARYKKHLTGLLVERAVLRAWRNAQ
jgi:CO/xanthine dehydrogenase FAD-binding subunit